jgi:hypothetical protein
MSPRRIVLGLLIAVAVVVGGAALPASAGQASSGYIYVYNSLGVSPQTNVGLVSVVIASTSPVASMTVSLYQNSTDVLDLPMNDFSVPANDGNGQLGVWTLTSPITTSQLALGEYGAYVTATDSGGDSVTLGFAGALEFQNMVLFPTFTSDRTTFDYDHQDVTFSGTATLLAPGGTPVPFANEPLELIHNGPTVPMTTDSNGAFTATVHPQQNYYQPDYFILEYAGDAQQEIAFNATPSIEISVTQSPVTIQASLAAVNVNQGAPDSVSGTVTYTDNGVTKPLTGQAISLYGDGLTYATTVTDGSGNFTMPVPTTGVLGYGREIWSVATPNSPLLAAGQANLYLTVAYSNAITGFRAKLSSFAVVTYSGCITGADDNVALEYAAKSTGPWLPLPATSFAYGSRCTQGSARGVLFLGQAIAKLAAAYYRADYVATPNWQGAVSGTVFLRKDLTKITSFSVTPQSVARNGDITVSGRLWAANDAGKWHAYGHRRVIVVFRYRGVYYQYRHAPVTSSSGSFSGTFPVYVSSRYFAQYNGDSTHFASASRRILVVAAAAALRRALGAASQFLVRLAWVRSIWLAERLAG